MAFLERMAGDGPALELGLGTGRVALPLAARGIRVDGIDISPAMVAKPGGDRLSVIIGDFAEVPVKGRYRLVFVVANTFCNLGTQERQVRCFEQVGAHLTEDGSFVVTGFVPHPNGFGTASTWRRRRWGWMRCDSTCAASMPWNSGSRRARRPVGGRCAPLASGNPLRLAERARPHGPTRRSPPQGALGRLAPGTLQLSKSSVRVCLWALNGQRCHNTDW